MNALREALEGLDGARGRGAQLNRQPDREFRCVYQPDQPVALHRFDASLSFGSVAASGLVSGFAASGFSGEHGRASECERECQAKKFCYAIF
jgi:hypothetical protein